MKRYILAGLIFVFPALSQAIDMQVYVNGQEPAEIVCYTYCGNSPAATYPCDQMPEIGKDCTVMVFAKGDSPECQFCPEPEKVTLAQVIYWLQVLTGGRQ